MLQSQDISYHHHRTALIEEIHQSFEPGVLYGLLGPNGSGKSTFLKTLGGLLKPSAGKVVWRGENLQDLGRLEMSRTLSFVPQNPHSAFAFSVWDFVAMGRYPHTLSAHLGSHDLQQVEWAIRIVDAWDLIERPITALSGGERQRVYIARALCTESPILLLDEPTSSLDIGHQLQIWQLLRTLVRQDRTILVATHDLPFAERFCDEVMVLHQGRSIASGAYEKVITADLLQEVFGVVASAVPETAIRTTDPKPTDPSAAPSAQLTHP